MTSSQSSLSFSTCGTSKSTIFSSSTPGDYAISVAVADGGTGTYNVNPAAFTLHVLGSSDTTAPVIAPHANVTAEATSASGAVVTYTSPATSDAVDGAGTATCTPASGSTFPLGSTTVTCNATDAAGNAATPTTFDVLVQDTTAPAIAAHGNVTAEATSGSGATVAYTSPATSDAVDGPGTASCLPASGSTFALGHTTVTCNATDNAGNAAASTTFDVLVQDTTAPVIAAHADVTAEATSASGATVTYTSPATSDAVDGPGTASCLPASGSTFALGHTTVTCNATDNAGNAAASTTFDVLVSLSLKGFYQPVDMNGVYNTVKGGSTVPLKFEVFAGSTELTATSIVDTFVQTKIACDGTTPSDEIEVVSTGGTSLRYDGTGGQFIQNWQTPKQAGACYRVTLTTDDGSSLKAYFQLK